MVEQCEFVKQDLKQSLAGYRVGVVDGTLQAGQIAVLQRYMSAGLGRSWINQPPPAFASFACVSIQSLSLQLYRTKFKLRPVEKICREPR